MDNAGKEREAVQLMAEAEKRVKASHSFLRGLFGGNTRIEEACEMYTRAANMFKMAKNWSAAGNAFCQAAKLHMQLQSKHDSATSFVDAGNAYKKADPQEAINCLNAAIDIYTDMGRFTIAAKHHITIAEIYETELVDIEKAIAHYEQSADYYKGEESNSSANKCLLKVASLRCTAGAVPESHRDLRAGEDTVVTLAKVGWLPLLRENAELKSRICILSHLGAVSDSYHCLLGKSNGRGLPVGAPQVQWLHSEVPESESAGIAKT
ncbi:beta-soluble NSF attachment protein-like [Acomys russatus]|uniref:beta-soluble NSF attachment protein-like n=1 Tax=Acomys russatus TaxID=60746 RepID=UPI0021E1FE09|nr:beta-soluble NSF attachment protein-like [Acomys russatus]